MFFVWKCYHLEGDSVKRQDYVFFWDIRQALNHLNLINTYKRKRLRRLRRSSGQGVFNASAMDLLYY